MPDMPERSEKKLHTAARHLSNEQPPDHDAVSVEFGNLGRLLS